MTKVIQLSWLSHQTAFSTIIPNFRQNNNFCDVTIVCDGCYFPAHRLILATFSDYFKEILEKIPCRHPFIIIQDVLLEDLKNLLDFIYVGEASIASHRMVTFLKAASNLKIKGLGLSDDPDASVLDFHEKIINLDKGQESEAAASCDKEIHEAAHSSLRSGRIRSGSGSTNEPVKIKLEASENNDVLQQAEKRIITDNTITNKDAEEMKLNETRLKKIIKNSKVVIEKCPEAVRMCKNLRDHITVPSVERSSQAQGLADYIKDDFLPDDLCANSKQEADKSSPIKEEPQDTSSQLRSEKNEDHLFSIQNVYSVKGSLEDTSSASQEYSTPSLPFSHWQQFHLDQESDQSHENEIPSSSSCFERSGSGEHRMEYFRVKIEPAEDICEDTIEEENREINTEDYMETSVYDFLTTELGPESISDLAKKLPHKQEVFTVAKKQPNELRDLTRKLKNSRRNKFKSKKIIKKVKFGGAKKKLLCSFCSYKTAISQNMTKHLRTHTGEKPYACTICSYRSTQKSSLNIHIQRHEVKVLNCEGCSFKTRRKIEMEEHKKTHIEAMSYKCNYCSFYTSRNQSLQNHLKKHERNEQRAPDSDSSLEPKKNIKMPINLYKSRKVSFLKRKLLARKKKKVLRVKSTVHNAEVEAKLGPYMQPGDVEDSRSKDGVIKLSVESTDASASKRKKTYEKNEDVVGESNSFASTSKHDEVQTEGNSFVSSIPDQFSEGIQGRIARQKKLLALNRIKQNFEHSAGSGAEDVAETVSENSRNEKSWSYRKKKCRGRRKSKGMDKVPISYMATDGQSTSAIGPVVVFKSFFNVAKVLGSQSLPPLSTIGTNLIPKTTMVSIPQSLCTTLGGQSVPCISGTDLVGTSVARVTPVKVSVAEVASVSEITPFSSRNSVIPVIPSSDFAPGSQMHKKAMTVKPNILKKGGHCIPFDEETEHSSLRIVSFESLSKAFTESSAVLDTPDGDNLPVTADVKSVLASAPVSCMLKEVVDNSKENLITPVYDPISEDRLMVDYKNINNENPSDISDLNEKHNYSYKNKRVVVPDTLSALSGEDKMLHSANGNLISVPSIDID